MDAWTVALAAISAGSVLALVAHEWWMWWTRTSDRRAARRARYLHTSEPQRIRYRP